MTDAQLITPLNGDGIFVRLAGLAGLNRHRTQTEVAFEEFASIVSSPPNDGLVVVDCTGMSSAGAVDAGTRAIFKGNGTVCKSGIVFQNCTIEFHRQLELILARYPCIDITDKIPKSPNGPLGGCTSATCGVELRDHYVPATSLKAELPTTLGKQVGVIRAAETDFLKESVAGCAALANPASKDRRRSTPLRSNYEFDAGLILGDPDKFAWLIARIVDDLLRIIRYVHSSFPQGGLQEIPRLIACTRNGATIGSAVQSYLVDVLNGHLRMDVVERFGPVQRVLESYDGGEMQGTRGTPWYVYVGDFVIGGQEIKVAEAYCNSLGRPLIAGIVMGSVLLWLTSDDYDQIRSGKVSPKPEWPSEMRRSSFSVFPLFGLNQLKLDPKLKYYFP